MKESKREIEREREGGRKVLLVAEGLEGGWERNTYSSFRLFPG